MGYTLADRVMTRIEYELSHAPPSDSPHWFIILYSIAGGTGSGTQTIKFLSFLMQEIGLGSRIVSRIREEYAGEQIMSVVVTPYEGGEVVVQSYNCMLCLAELTRY